MEPTTTGRHPAVGGIDEDEIQAEEGLNELEVEDLLGRHVDFDEHDDWRAADL